MTTEDKSQIDQALERQRRARDLILYIIGGVALIVAATLVILAGSPRSPYEDIPRGFDPSAAALLLGPMEEESPPVLLEVVVDMTDIGSARLHKTLRRLVDRYVRGGEVILVEYLVLQPNASYEHGLAANEAVFCASEQNGAWAFHDALFGMWEQQFEMYGRIQAPPPAYSAPGEIELAARQVQLDPDALAACMSEGIYHSALDVSYSIGQSETVPSVYINGEPLTDEAGQLVAEPSFEQLDAAIQSQLLQNTEG